MENSGATDGEIRQIAELSMDNKEDEAGAMLAEIGTSAEDELDEFRRVVREEVQAALKASDRHRRRLSTLATVAGLLAGMVAAGWIVVGLIYYFEIGVSISGGAALTFICSAIGAFVGWSKAN